MRFGFRTWMTAVAILVVALTVATILLYALPVANERLEGYDLDRLTAGAAQTADAIAETLCGVADATPEDEMAALDAACEVQKDWAKHTPRERGEILRRAYEKVMERVDDLALLMTLEMGKPVEESRGEILYGADFLR